MARPVRLQRRVRVELEPLEHRALLASAGGAALEAGGLEVAVRQMEYLDRGVVATRVSSSTVFVSWRLFALDPAGTGFNVYRSINGAAATKLNSAVLTAGTNYSDATAGSSSASYAYTVRPVVGGVEQSASLAYTLKPSTPSGPFYTVPIRAMNGYVVRHVSIADLNGDGRYDFVVDRKPTAVVNEVATQPSLVEAYLHDGTFLWSVDLGPGSFDVDNIEPGPTAIDIGNWDGVVAADLDRNGRAEVFLRSADGLTFGDGATLRYPQSTDVQFMSALDGMTGAELARIPIPSDYLQDGPMGASFAVGFLDGVKPSLVAKMKNRQGSGSFNEMFVAYDFDGTSLTQKWKHNSTETDNGHNIRVADVDGDGFDDVADTAKVIDGRTGAIKYNMSPTIGHGDRFYIGDFDPARPGLEYYGVQQNNPSMMMEYYADASNGTLLYATYGTSVSDNGRGEVGDIDPTHPGAEFWSFYGMHNVNNSVHTQVGTASPWPSIGVQWDGDLLAEVLSTDSAVIDQWNVSAQARSRVATLYNMGSGATTYDGWPVQFGDIIGDWREEVVYEKGTRDGLVIFTTSSATTTRLYTLAQNPLYRNNLTTKGYMQTRTLDYYLGDGMATPPTPSISVLPSGAGIPTVATKASATPSPVVGTTTALSVLGADDAGAGGLTYTWSVKDSNGIAVEGVSFSGNGTNAARNSVATFSATGTYIFTVTIRDAGGRSTLSNVTVVVNATVSSIAITPGTAKVPGNSNLQLIATAYDQFGAAITASPAFAWTASSGTVDANGLFTPAATGAVAVQASAGAVVGNASINVSGTGAAAPTILAATPVAASQVNLSWTDVAGDSGYVIEASTDGGTVFAPIGDAPTSATSYYATGLAASTSYHFRVRSKNVSGAGLPSGSVTATTFALPASWWKLNESAGTTAAEATGNGLPGITRNGPAWVAGKSGNALSFDGANDYVDLPNNTLSTSSGSVSMWVKSGANFGSYAILFYFSNDTYGNGLGSQSEFHLNFTSSEKIQLYIRGSASGLWDQDVNISSPNAYANSAWHHVVATWNAGTSANLYVDGALVATDAFTPAFTFANSQRTYLGRTNLNTNLYTGQIDDVRTFTDPLAPAQVQSLFADRPALSIVSSGYDHQAAPNKLTYRFGANVQASLDADDVLIERIGGGTILSTGVSFDTSTNTATFTLAAPLPDGDYRATLRADRVGDANGARLASDHTQTFFFMSGDVNHDRAADFDDLLILASHYGTTGKLFGQGNLDYDAGGSVNFDDLLILAARYGSTLSAPSAFAAMGQDLDDDDSKVPPISQDVL